MLRARIGTHNGSTAYQTGAEDIRPGFARPAIAGAGFLWVALRPSRQDAGVTLALSAFIGTGWSGCCGHPTGLGKPGVMGLGTCPFWLVSLWFNYSNQV